jgi:hypothetical protein
MMAAAAATGSEEDGRLGASATRAQVDNLPHKAPSRNHDVGARPTNRRNVRPFVHVTEEERTVHLGIRHVDTAGLHDLSACAGP